MNEMGIIYHGAYDDIAERQWNYGQVIVNQKEEFIIYCRNNPPPHASSLITGFWMPACTSWTDRKCPSQTEETRSK